MGVELCRKSKNLVDRKGRMNSSETCTSQPRFQKTGTMTYSGADGRNFFQALVIDPPFVLHARGAPATASKDTTNANLSLFRRSTASIPCLGT